MGLHLHEMRDTDKHFIIDPVTRAITNANAAKNKLIQFDHNSEIFTFEIPQYVDGHDMNKCDKVEIHYINIDGKTKEQSKDLFNAKAAAKTDSDLVFNLEDGKLLFCWKISGNATKYAGSLNFLVCFSCLDDAGSITYKWHTDIFKGINISDGLSNTEAVAEQYSDVLEQWKKELENASGSGSGSGGGSYVVNIIDNGDDTFRTDKTFAQISEAIAAGKEAVCVFGTYHYQLVTCTDTKIVFSVSECEGVVSYKTLTLDNTNGDNEVIYKFDMPGYQYETDGNLQTEDITVVGAINEVNAKVNGVINNGTVISKNADFAEVGEWSDGNPDAEDRTGYFVSVDTSEPGKTMVKATSTSDVRGVAIEQPAFSTNASADKYDTEGNLLKQYDYVCFAGFAPVIDNGTCAVNGRCMPSNDGTAVPSSNNMGYQVIERIDNTHVLILVEPQADMMVRIKEDVSELKGDLNDYDERINALEEGGSASGATGFSQAFVTAMTNFVKHVLYDHEEDGSVYGDALIRSMSVAPSEGVKLESISVVANKTTADEGTLAQDLDLTVTAHYSDGSEAEVLGWTATGTIAVGLNTITVKYNGKSATVTITGVKVVKYVLVPDAKQTTFQTGYIYSDMGVTASSTNKRLLGLNCSNTYDEDHTVKLSFISPTNAWNGGYIGVMSDEDFNKANNPTVDRFNSTLSDAKLYNAQYSSSWLVDKEYSYTVTIPADYHLCIGFINGDPALFDVPATVTIEVIS